MPEIKNDSPLDDYIQPKRSLSRKALGLFMVLLLAGMVLLFKSAVIDATMSPTEVRAAVEIFDISSGWVVKETFEYEDEEGIILVPEISFRLRNRSDDALRYLFFLGVFRFMDTGKTMGEGYQMVLQEPLAPGAESQRVNLRSGFGYRASSQKAFTQNRANWRNAFVEVYIRSRNSELGFYKSYYISRKIEGMAIDVKI